MTVAHRALRVILVAAFCGLCLPREGPAQAADSLYTLGEVTVTATREAVRPARAAQRVTVLDEEALRSTAARSLADVLSARSTIFVRRYGQGLATVSQRGGGPSQTQLLIDGLRLSDPQLGQFDLGLLPSHLVAAVEILHGPGSALYGTDGLAGIVHLRSRRGEVNHASVRMEAGPYGERAASAGVSLHRNELAGLLSVEYVRSDGDFPFLNRALFPAREERRQNADSERRSAFGTLRAEAGRHSLRGAFLYAGAQQGVPGPAGAAPQGERRWDEHVRLWAEDRMPAGVGALHLRGFVHRGSLRYRNETLELDVTGRTVTSGMEATYHAAATRQVDLTIGASGGYGSARHPSLSSSASEVHGAAFVSASATSGRLRLYPAARLDAYRQTSGTSTALTPRLGANVQVSGRLPVYLKLSVAEGFRVPTFNDRFWLPGGNPDLRPERSRSFDAGVYLDARRVVLEVTGFASRTSNQIVWTAGDAYWYPVNVARTLARGVEASLKMRAHDAVTVGGLYAFTRAVDRSNPSEPSFGRQVRYVPRHQARAYASARYGPLRMDLHSRYLGRRYVTSDESEHLEATFVADAQVGLKGRVGGFRAGFSVVVENLLGARYAVIQGYPMPPRHARIRLLLETQ